MRPLLRWLLFGFCLAVFALVMGWISQRMLVLEEQRRTALRDSEIQEKTRLALWRMDAAASALLIRENARPASHYRSFYPPEDLLPAQPGGTAQARGLLPSPLLGTLPDLVRLHFESLPGQTSFSSPQAPSGDQQEIASQWYVLGPQVQESRQRLADLEKLFASHPEMQSFPAALPPSWLDLNVRQQVPPPADKESPKASGTVSAASRKDQFEQSQRAASILSNNSFAEKAAAPQLQKKIAPPAASSWMRRAASSLADTASESSAPYGREARAGTGAAAPSPAALPALAGDLQPVWLGQELLLLRQATVNGQPRLQGVWLDWPALRKRLLGTLQDLLPDARLQPVPETRADTDAATLVTLPVRLLTGHVPLDHRREGSLLKYALIVAWGCLIAAMVAIAYVLHRAIQLSERRGAFVSAVTHELRTPLTTFRLYSEMLADDMIPDAGTRKDYLKTLCEESSRLMHLVENVLVYSRIERGRTAGRKETLLAGQILDRILPRLEQRTTQAGLELKLTLPESARGITLCVDALAVEQILFNLTDNACKYAAPDSDPPQLDLTVQAGGPDITFTLRDYGPGLPAAQKKRLFQPFSKSATEAAHSAPGVGLGLALSRQLARELGGDLKNLPVPGRGTAFVLSLQKAE